MVKLKDWVLKEREVPPLEVQGLLGVDMVVDMECECVFWMLSSVGCRENLICRWNFCV